jgi:hypothetical protein
VEGIKRSISCRKLFNKSNILPLASKFLLIIIICCEHGKISNKFRDTQNKDTGTDTTSMSANTNLTKYQKGVCNIGIRLFSNLPPRIFKPALKEYLLFHSSFAVEKFTIVIILV